MVFLFGTLDRHYNFRVLPLLTTSASQHLWLSFVKLTVSPALGKLLRLVCCGRRLGITLLLLLLSDGEFRQGWC